jgi:exodeoxyribonuclease V gamma subunit
VRFVERPVRAFLRRRLGLSVADFSDEVEDALPVELDGLGKWGVGQRLLDARLGGAEPRASILAEIARGTLPPGRLGMPVIERIQPTVEEIVACVPEGAAGSVDVRVLLLDGRTLSGTVPGVGDGVLRTVTFSRVSARHRVAAWVRLLALAAAGRSFESVVVGRAPSGSDARVTIARVPALEAAEALDHLAVLLDLFERGMREPAPLACQTSAAYAAAARAGGNPVVAARDAWKGSHVLAGEDVEPEHQLVLGGVVPFEELLEAPARPDETGPWWDPTEPRRFARWARRLWDGLLQRERMEER